MKMRENVYKIIWADDEIDNLLDDDTIEDMNDMGFEVIGRAHDGEEFKKILNEKRHYVDAVILDANFNETDKSVRNERDITGLNYAWSVLSLLYEHEIPFFLFTNRDEESIREAFKDIRRFNTDFQRHETWFSKSGEGEFYEMLEKIKKAVDDKNSPEFVVKNRFCKELDAAGLLGKEIKEFIFSFLLYDYTDRLEELKEPFKLARDVIEKIFNECEQGGLIPPITDNTNGTAYYLLKGKYKVKDKTNDNNRWLYEAREEGMIMPKPIAQMLVNATYFVQDVAHCKNGLELKVNDYYNEHKDFHLLRSVMYPLIDVILWYGQIVSYYSERKVTGTLWNKIDEELKE